MPDPKCGKLNRCRHANDCPYNKYPLVNYLCFDNKRVWAQQAYEKRKKNKIDTAMNESKEGT